MLGRAGEPRKILDLPAIAPVPAKAGTRPRKRVPANRGVHVIQEKTVGSRQRHALRNQALALPRLQPPEKNALQIRIPVKEKRFFGAKSARKLLKEEAERFGQSLIDLHGRADARKDLNLRCKAPVAIAEKSEARATGKCARCEAEPGNHANPVNFACPRRQQDQCQRERPSKRQCQVQAPANSGRVTDEHIRKPNGNCRRADVHEETQRQKIAGQREVPGAIAEEAFNLSKEKRNDKVGGQKRSGAARGTGRRLLENR